MSDARRVMSLEARARLIADSMGTLGHEQRRKMVERTALEHLRSAVALATNLIRQGVGPAELLED